jgi:uncharacterized linocin/CFP29 family protein
VNHLLRSIAPITPSGWGLLDEEASQRLVSALAARKLVDFSGPHGWDHSATNLGRTEAIAKTPAKGVGAAQRRVLPLVELRADFSVSRSELRDSERGAAEVDLQSLDAAAASVGLAENSAVFHGWKQTGIVGIAEASPHSAIQLGEDFDGYPRQVGRAVEALRQAGIAGPYGIALGPDGYTGVVETTEHGGYPLFEHLRKIIGGPLVWAPGVEGAAVVSQRGGDFLFEAGEDLSIGYDRHDDEGVHLYLVESFTFRVATPEAAFALTP